MRALIPAMRQVMLDHPKVDPNPARVRFTGVSDWSLNIEIFAYVLTNNMDEFLLVQEEVLLGIMDAIQAAGTALAVPVQINRVTREAGERG